MNEILDEKVAALFEPADPQNLGSAVIAALRRNDLAVLGQHTGTRVMQN